jgi:hypothetical protein
MIKNQCNKCRSNDTCQENKVFDDTSCPNYIRLLDLEKHEVDSDKHENSSDGVQLPMSTTLPVTESLDEKQGNDAEIVITSEELKRTTNIHGWLSFFLFSVVVGGLFSFIFPIATYNLSEYGGSAILALTGVIFGGLLCAVAFMTLYAFRQRKPDAVFLGKTYIIAIFALNLLCLFEGNFESIVKNLVWSTGWFIYLCSSKQVEKVIPKDFRKLSGIDHGLLITLIIVPLLLLSFGIIEIQKSQEEETATFIQKTTLSEGELTDGKVVFTPPADFTCEKNEVEGLVVYNIEDEDVAHVLLCSDYDSDQSASNIKSYWKNWENEADKKRRSKLIADEKCMINGNTYYYKVKRYDINGIYVYWRFSMLFDNASSKVCVMSCYDYGVDDYFNDIIESIRFH